MKNKASEALQDLDPTELDAVVGGGTWAQTGRAMGESLGRFGGMGDPKAGAAMGGTIGEYAGRLLDTISGGGHPTPTDTHQPGSPTDQRGPTDGSHPSDPQAPSGDTHDPTTNGANPDGDPNFGADPGNHGGQPAEDNTYGDFGPADHGASADHTGDPTMNGANPDGDPNYGGNTGGVGDQSDTTYGDYSGGGDYGGDSGGGDF